MVLDLPYVANIQQLLGLLPDDQASFIIKLPPPLVDGSDLWIHGETMAHEIMIDVTHF